MGDRAGSSPVARILKVAETMDVSVSATFGLLYDIKLIYLTEYFYLKKRYRILQGGHAASLNIP